MEIPLLVWVLVAGLVVLILVVLVSYFIAKLSTRISYRGVELRLSKLARLDEDRASALLESSTAPRVYYHLDTETLSGLYRQLVSPEALAISREVEQKSSRKGGLKLGIGPVAPEVGAERDSRTKSVFEPESDPDRIARMVEESLLKSESISAVDLTRNMEAAIDNALSPLLRQGFVVPPEVDAGLRQAWRKFQGASRLSSLTGFVVVKATFQIGTEAVDRLSLTTAATAEAGHAAAVYASIRRADLRRSGEAALQVGSKVELSCVGKVVSWEAGEERLTLLPLALF